jgi:hypothetical protein
MPRARNNKHEAMPSLAEDKPPSFSASSVAQAFASEAHRLQEVCLEFGGKAEAME